MATTQTQPADARPAPALSILPVHPDACCTAHTLHPEEMTAIRLDPDEVIDSTWVSRMRAPYTSRAAHLLARAQAIPSTTSPAPRTPAGAVPLWAQEAAARHRGLLDALGMLLPHDPDAAHAHGAVLVQHLVPAITYGWYLVTTVYATDHEVILLEGQYAEHEVHEPASPVHWVW